MKPWSKPQTAALDTNRKCTCKRPRIRKTEDTHCAVCLGSLDGRRGDAKQVEVVVVHGHKATGFGGSKHRKTRAEAFAAKQKRKREKRKQHK